MTILGGNSSSSGIVAIMIVELLKPGSMPAAVPKPQPTKHASVSSITYAIPRTPCTN